MRSELVEVIGTEFKQEKDFGFHSSEKWDVIHMIFPSKDRDNSFYCILLFDQPLMSLCR